jgi:putative transcriptional regulator
MSKSPAAGVGARIRQARDQLGWTQGELARRLEKTQSEVNRWEQGKVRPGYDTAVQLAKALGVDARVLLEGEGGESDPAASQREAEQPPEDATWRSEDEAWIDLKLATVRNVNGHAELPAEEIRRRQIDVLTGMIEMSPRPEVAARLRAIQGRLRAGETLEEAEHAAATTVGAELRAVRAAERVAAGPPGDPERELWRRIDAVEADRDLSANAKMIKIEGLLAVQRIALQDRETRLAESRTRVLDRESAGGEARSRAVEEEARNATARAQAVGGMRAWEPSEPTEMEARAVAIAIRELRRELGTAPIPTPAASPNADPQADRRA